MGALHNIAPLFTAAIYFVLTTAAEIHSGAARSGIFGSSRDVCDDASTFQTTLQELRQHSDLTVLSLVGSATSIVTQSQVEVSLIAESERVIQETEVQLAECERLQDEALLDAQNFREQLEELAQIARTDIFAHGNGSGSSLLARSPLVHRRVIARESEESTTSRQSAEMRSAVTKAARKVVRCRERSLLKEDDVIFKTRKNNTDDECHADWAQLQILYQQAHVHISSLYNMSLVVSTDTACRDSTLLVRDGRQTELLLQISQVREEICRAYQASDDLAVVTTELASTLDSTSDLLGDACLSTEYRRYSSAVSVLLGIFSARPQTPGACSEIITVTSNATVASDGTSLLSATKQADDQELEELKKRALGLREQMLHYRSS